MKPSRTCEQLGLCQRRNPSCKGCSWTLAPNVVQGPFKRQRFTWIKRNWHRVAVWSLIAAWVLTWTAVAAFYLGYKGLLNG
jgi:hypothetical protein